MVSDVKREVAVFGGGCFWCTEAVFKMLRGVSSVVPGYAGGSASSPQVSSARASSEPQPNSSSHRTPTYEEVCGGKTGYAEVIKIEFSPDEITFQDLLTVFFASHDPTTRNRQGNDVGTQYRSIILYANDAQRKEVEAFIRELNASNEHGAPIVTEIAPLTQFYEAEGYHKDYFAKNPENPYCELVINPKLEKVQKQFAELLKTHGGLMN